MPMATNSTAVGSRPSLVSAILLPALLAMVTLTAATGKACEKHLNGHQNGSDTHQEVQSESQQR